MNDFTVWANIRFRRTDEGGLRASFCPYDFFTGEQCQLGYLMDIDGQYFDFRIFQPPNFIELGQSYEMMVKFLFPELASRRLFVGKKFTVWHSRTIADGIVVNINDAVSEIPRKCRLGTPDFYLVPISNGCGGKMKSCFLMYSSCPHGRDCICGVYVQDTDSVGLAARQKCDTQKMTLYCPVDILSCGTACPWRVVEIQAIAGGREGNYDLLLCQEWRLFKDLDLALNHAKEDDTRLNMLDACINMPAVLENAKKILRESDLFRLAASYEL